MIKNALILSNYLKSRLVNFYISEFPFRLETKKTLSMEASSIKESKESHQITAATKYCLSAVVMYGANSSGKSNVLQASCRPRVSFARQCKIKSWRRTNHQSFKLIMNQHKNRHPSEIHCEHRQNQISISALIMT